MGKSIVVTGGARSGKSHYAEMLALGFTGRGIYIATAEARDVEMAERIKLHQARRGREWTTRGEPVALLKVLRETDGDTPRLVDCLTLWLTNLMLAGRDWSAEIEALAATLPELEGPVVFVTNEVGAGIVPDNALARTFRDAAGLMNQKIATACDEVYLTVAGYPLRLKPSGTEG